jgi:hypothetical protein
MRMGVVFRCHPCLGNLSMSTLARHHRLLVPGTGTDSCLVSYDSAKWYVAYWSLNSLATKR